MCYLGPDWQVMVHLELCDGNLCLLPHKTIHRTCVVSEPSKSELNSPGLTFAGYKLTALALGFPIISTVGGDELAVRKNQGEQQNGRCSCRTM